MESFIFACIIAVFLFFMSPVIIHLLAQVGIVVQMLGKTITFFGEQLEMPLHKVTEWRHRENEYLESKKKKKITLYGGPMDGEEFIAQMNMPGRLGVPTEDGVNFHWYQVSSDGKTAKYESTGPAAEQTSRDPNWQEREPE